MQLFARNLLRHEKYGSYSRDSTVDDFDILQTPRCPLEGLPATFYLRDHHRVMGLFLLNKFDGKTRDSELVSSIMVTAFILLNV